MNSFQIALVLALAVTLRSASGACVDDCRKDCDDNAPACPDTSVHSLACEEYKACTGGCVEACVCIEACADQCTPSYQQCVNGLSDGDTFGEQECKDSFSYCDNDCQVDCNLRNGAQLEDNALDGNGNSQSS